MMANETTTVVIFGGTGDLTRRKLLPALFQLACKGRLPESIRIVGVARREYSDEAFRELMGDSVREFGDLAVRTGEWADFARNVFYVRGDLDAPETYVILRKRLEEWEDGNDIVNQLFYLSVGPEFFGTVIENLGSTGLAQEENGWRRVVIEKPFGNDLEFAKSLNRGVHRVFGRESDIPYRPLPGQRNGAKSAGLPFR